MFIGGVFSTPRFGQARFLSLGYDGDFSIHRVPWVFSPLEGKPKPSVKKQRSFRGSRMFFFRLMQIICFKLQVECFFCANWICVCVFFVCFGFWNWNYMKGMSKTKVETDWTAEPCLCFELFSKWVDQITKKTNVLLHMQCFALLFPNKFACSIVGNMLTSSYSHQLVDVPGSSPWSEVEKSQKTPGGKPWKSNWPPFCQSSWFLNFTIL